MYICDKNQLVEMYLIVAAQFLYSILSYVPCTSRAMAGGDSSLSEHYAFCGMQSLFDQHKESITVVKFANDDKTRLACACDDGTLSVFVLDPEPPSLLCSLQKHKGEVNGKGNNVCTLQTNKSLY